MSRTCCSPTAGPATCASSTTSCSAPWCSPKAPVIEAEHILFEKQRRAPKPPPALSPVLQQTLQRAERDVILEALRAAHGSRREVAEKLGISPRTLRYKLARIRNAGVEVPAA